MNNKINTVRHADVIYHEAKKGYHTETEAWDFVWQHTNATGSILCGISFELFAVWRSKFNHGKLGVEVRERILKGFNLKPFYKQGI